MAQAPTTATKRRPRTASPPQRSRGNEELKSVADGAAWLADTLERPCINPGGWLVFCARMPKPLYAGDCRPLDAGAQGYIMTLDGIVQMLRDLQRRVEKYAYPR